MALDFDNANNSNVDHGDIALSTTLISGCFWILADALAVSDQWIDKFVSTASGFRVGTEASVATKLQFVIAAGANYAGTVASFISVGTPVHFGFAYDGGAVGNDLKLRIFKNGAPVAVSHSTTVPSTIGDGADTLKVGARTAGTAPDSAIGHVKLWSGASLTDAEMLLESQSYWAKRREHLVLDAPYDDGTSARDYSGAGNHGTATVIGQRQAFPISFGAKPRML